MFVQYRQVEGILNHPSQPAHNLHSTSTHSIQPSHQLSQTSFYLQLPTSYLSVYIQYALILIPQHINMIDSPLAYRQQQHDLLSNKPKQAADQSHQSLHKNFELVVLCCATPHTGGDTKYSKLNAVSGKLLCYPTFEKNSLEMLAKYL